MKRSLVAVLVIGVVFASALAAQKDNTSSPEAQLGAIIHQAEAERDYEGAIPRYQKFIVENASNKPLAAKALYHLALAFEEVGNRVESQKALERVTVGFPDQKDLVEAARRRLSPSASGISDRSVCVGCGGPTYPVGAVSWDGRIMAFYGPGGLSIRDLSSGKETQLQSGRIISPVLSHDGKKIAYLADTGRRALPTPTATEIEIGPGVVSPGAFIGSEQYQLRVVANEPGAKVQTLVKNPEFLAVIPAAWAPDDNAILAVVHKRVDGTWMIAWVSATDGTVTQLKSLGWRYTCCQTGALGLPTLSPDGRSVAYAAKVADKQPEFHGDPAFFSDPDGVHIYVLPADPKATTSEDELVKGASINESPVWAPDGKSLLFLSDRSGKFGLWTVSLADRSLKQVRLDTGEIHNIGVTRQGSYFYTRPHTITEPSFTLSPLNSGSQAKTPGHRTMTGTSLAWSPDVRSIAYSKPTATMYRPGQTEKVNGLFVYSLVTETEKRYIPPDGLAIAHEAGGTRWFHDGKALLQFMRDDKGELYLYHIDLGTGAFSLLTRISRFVPVAISSDDRTVYFPMLAEPRAASTQTDTARVSATPQNTLALTAILEPRSCQRERIVQMDLSSRTQTDMAVISQPSTLVLSPDDKTLYASACGFESPNVSGTSAMSFISQARLNEIPTTQEDAEIVALDTTENRRHRSISFPGPIKPGFVLAPDGRTLAVVTSPRPKLVRIGVDGTGLQELYAPESGNVVSVFWNKAGTSVLVQKGRESALVRVTALGGTPEVVVKSPDLSQNALLSPDHSHVIVPAVAGGHEVRVLDNAFRKSAR